MTTGRRRWAILVTMDLHQLRAAGSCWLGGRATDRRLSADDLRRIEVTVADAVPVWGPHPEGM